MANLLAYVSPLGRALVDKGLYLPESWTSDCEVAGVPEDRQGYRSKTELALDDGGAGTGATRGGRRAVLPGGLAALGMWYVLDVPSGFTVWPPEPAWTSAEYLRASAANPGCETSNGQPATIAGGGLAVTITVAEGSQGPRATFSAPRGCADQGARPANPLGRLPPEPGRQRTPTTCPIWEAPVGVETLTWTSTRPKPGLAGITTWPCACWTSLTGLGGWGGAGNAAPGTVRANRVAAVA